MWLSQKRHLATELQVKCSSYSTLSSDISWGHFKLPFVNLIIKSRQKTMSSVRTQTLFLTSTVQELLFLFSYSNSMEIFSPGLANNIWSLQWPNGKQLNYKKTPRPYCKDSKLTILPPLKLSVICRGSHRPVKKVTWLYMLMCNDWNVNTALL